MKNLPWLFSLTLFMTALLSFSVQPIFGKMMLPMIGGAPAGWIVAMAFFQMALLAGYGVSYALGRFSPWVHAVALIVLYALGYAYLPPHMPAVSGDIQGGALSFAVVKALLQAIFVPFLALTATTAALQRVFAATSHATAQDPYYLFVASNIGSFIGLFAYPLILEPFFGLKAQTGLWQILYVIVVALIICCAAASWIYRNREQAAAIREEVQPVTVRQMFRWLVLAFVPCSLSMGVTSVITNDVGGLPLFWVLPLGLYLLTFILAFAKTSPVKAKNLGMYHLVGASFIIVVLGIGVGYKPGGDLFAFLSLGIVLLAVFFTIALSCHRQLADSRPGTSRLTLYYLIIAVGGGLAGMMHAFVIPYVLPYSVEFAAMVVLSLMLAPDVFRERLASPRLRLFKKLGYPIVLIGILGLVLSVTLHVHGYAHSIYMVPSAIFVFTVIILAFCPRHLLVLGLVALIGSTFIYYPGHVIFRDRNFFGTMAIYEVPQPGYTMRIFVHGNTIHGLEKENVDKTVPAKEVSYYAKNGPIDDVLRLAPNKNLAVVGLGAGVMACFADGFTTDFYEIDADVEHVARKYFHYLSDCPPRAVVIGDGRLELAKSTAKYDVIMEDAFNSDGIPMHLLTLEALRMYETRLDPNGMLLFHISNRYIDLKAPLAALAKAEHLHAYSKMHTPAAADVNRYSTPSLWAAIPMSRESGDALMAEGWQELESDRAPWTDDRSSLIEAVVKPAFNLW